MQTFLQHFVWNQTSWMCVYREETSNMQRGWIYSIKASAMVVFVDISLWAIPLMVQQRVKLSSIIELEWDWTAWQNRQMPLARGVLWSRCWSGRTNQACKPLKTRRRSSKRKSLRTHAECGAHLHSLSNIKGVPGSAETIIQWDELDMSSDSLCFCQQIP